MNDSVFNVVRLIHILNGSVALVIAPLAMIAAKGGTWHRRWGRIYFWAMAGVALTATVMCWLRSGIFLFLIAILSFYLAATGYRALRRKTPEDRPEMLDWAAAGAMLLTGIGFIVSGVVAADLGEERWVRFAFGTIGLYLGGLDVWRFLRPPAHRRAWWFTHMTRFLSAYIATVTAFSVVNLRFLPYLWRWLGPTAVGIVLITMWRQYYVRQFNRAAAK